MPKDGVIHVRKNHSSSDLSHEEAESLLSGTTNDEEADPVVQPGPRPQQLSIGPRRQSSLSRPLGNGTPRTPRTANRVRFDIEERRNNEQATNGHAPESTRPGEWLEEEDYLSHHSSGGRRSSTGQRAPLLTDIEAPSVTLATADLGFNAEDLLESARPKSGMRSAFMNMANSIMCDKQPHCPLGTPC